MNPQPVTMYGAAWCADCNRAKFFFKQYNIDYDYIDIDTVPGAADKTKEISGLSHIPVIVLPDSSFLVEPSNAELREKFVAPTTD